MGANPHESFLLKVLLVLPFEVQDGTVVLPAFVICQLESVGSFVFDYAGGHSPSTGCRPGSEPVRKRWQHNFVDTRFPFQGAYNASQLCCAEIECLCHDGVFAWQAGDGLVHPAASGNGLGGQYLENSIEQHGLL